MKHVRRVVLAYLLANLLVVVAKATGSIGASWVVTTVGLWLPMAIFAMAVAGGALCAMVFGMVAATLVLAARFDIDEDRKRSDT